MLQHGPLVQFLKEHELQEIFYVEEPSHPSLCALRKGLSKMGIYQVYAIYKSFRSFSCCNSVQNILYIELFMS